MEEFYSVKFTKYKYLSVKERELAVEKIVDTLEKKNKKDYYSFISKVFGKIEPAIWKKVLLIFLMRNNTKKREVIDAGNDFIKRYDAFIEEVTEHIYKEQENMK